MSDVRVARLGVSVVALLWLAWLSACSAGDGGERPNGATGGTGGSSGTGGAGGVSGFSNPVSGQGGSGGVGANSGSSGVGGAFDDDAGNCGGIDIEAKVEVVEQPGNLLILFDRSNSMAQTWNGQTRFDAARNAISQALTPIADKLTIGAIMFPTDPGTFLVCSVDPISSAKNIDFMPGPDFLAAWDTYWMTEALVLGTPISLAFDRGWSALDAALQAGTLTGNIVVLLVTDGEPACDSGTGAAAVAGMWAGLGIKTHVLGLPGIGGNGPTFLDSVAMAGGTTMHKTPADSAALATELEQVAISTVTRGVDNCSIELPEPPEDPELVEMAVTDASTGLEFAVPRERAPGDGWTMASDGSQITLTGALCDEAKAGRFTNIRFVFGCLVLPILPPT
jgi:hypothetical protein